MVTKVLLLFAIMSSIILVIGFGLFFLFVIVCFWLDCLKQKIKKTREL